MYCSHCGKQISDNAKFCNFCGAEQVIYNQPSAAQSQPSWQQTPKAPPVQSYQVPKTPPVQPRPAQAAPQGAGNNKPKKSVGKKILIGFLVFVGVCLLSRAFLTPLFLKSLDKDEPSPMPPSETYTLPSLPVPSVETVNPDYTDIFFNCGITEFNESYSDPSLSTDSFVQVSENGVVEKLQLGYDPEEDTIIEMFDIVYVPTADYSEDQLTALDEVMRERLAPCELEGFCTVTYEKYSLDGCYKTTVHFTDLNNGYNLARLSNLNILALGDSPDGQPLQKLSMKQTESGLTANGYIQKYI